MRLQQGAERANEPAWAFVVGEKGNVVKFRIPLRLFPLHCNKHRVHHVLKSRDDCGLDMIAKTHCSRALLLFLTLSLAHALSLSHSLTLARARIFSLSLSLSLCLHSRDGRRDPSDFNGFPHPHGRQALKMARSFCS